MTEGRWLRSPPSSLPTRIHFSPTLRRQKVCAHTLFPGAKLCSINVMSRKFRSR